MLDYVTDYKDALHAIGITGYDENKFKELAYTDYKLDAIIRLYYASGFNVFRCTNESLRKRDKNIVKKDNLINYKTFNSKFEISDDLLMVDLASIITLVTSENCDSSDIEHVIGRMRFI